MNVDTKFHVKPFGLGSLIGVLILLVQYLAVVLTILVMVKGTSVLDPIMPLGQAVMEWIAQLTSSATPPTNP